MKRFRGRMQRGTEDINEVRCYKQLFGWKVLLLTGTDDIIKEFKVRKISLHGDGDCIIKNRCINLYGGRCHWTLGKRLTIVVESYDTVEMFKEK